MTNKSFLSKEELASKEHQILEKERKLLPRLRIMGYLMIGIGFVSLVYALIAPKEEAIYAEIPAETELYAGLPLTTDDTPFELNPTEVLNFYFVSATFVIGGISLLLIARKKRRFTKI